MASSIRNQNATCIIGHYLLCNSSSIARCGPTTVTVHALLVSRARIATFTEQPLIGNEVTKSAYLSYCFPHKLLDGWEGLRTKLEILHTLDLF